MRRLVLIFMSVLAAGCFNPDDIFPIHGQVVSARGVEGLTVELLRASETGFAGTCDGAKPFKTTTTDADGNFTFEVFRAQSMSLGGMGQFCFRVRVAFPSGTVDTADLGGVFTETWLTKFRDWEPNARLENGELKFTPVYPTEEADDAGYTLAHRAEFETTDGGLAWVLDDLFLDTFSAAEQQPAFVRRPMKFDSRQVEDFSGELVLSALTSERISDGFGPLANISVTTVNMVASQRLPLSGTTVPLSRDAGCPSITRPCTLTDGDLQVAELGSRQSVTLELGAEAFVSSVVFRELEGGAPILSATFFDADGGTVRTDQFAYEFSQISLSTIPRPRQPRDGGEPFFGSAPAWIVFDIDGGVTAKKVTFGFPAGVRSAAEISLY